MVVLEILLVALVVFAVTVFLTGRMDGLRAAPRDRAPDGLPAGHLEGGDLDRARFGLAFRGYEMSEVDAVLDRLRDQMRADERERDALRDQLARERRGPADG